MPLPVEKSQGSVSSLISRFQNAADANERRKAQEGQPRPVGRLSVGGIGAGPAAKKVVEGVKGVLSSATNETLSTPVKADKASEKIPDVGDAETSATSQPIEEHNGTAVENSTTIEPTTDSTPSAKAAAAEKSSSVSVAPQSPTPTQDVSDADTPNHPDRLKTEATLPQSPITQSPSITSSNQSKLPSPALKSPLKPPTVSSKSLTPQRTGSLRSRASNGADPLKSQPTGSSPSPLKPQLTGTPTRPTAASLARAKDAQERRAATEAKLASQPRKSMTPGRTGIPVPSPTSRERKVSTTSPSTVASTSSVPRPVRRASATPSPAPTPISDKKKALTPSSSLMRGTASSKLKAASASPSPTQAKTKSSTSRTGTTARVKPAAVTASKGAEVASPEPQIIGRIGLAGAPSNRRKTSGEA